MMYENKFKNINMYIFTEKYHFLSIIMPKREQRLTGTWPNI